ncbi:MAG: hypothetical protein KIT27_06695 [Legionellales bacterium]|nr:hypothetical protein [Legionellales bacterium]
MQSVDEQPVNHQAIPLARFKIVKHYYDQSIARVMLYDHENAQTHLLTLPELVQHDDFLTSLNATDLRIVMSMWVDYEILQERQAIRDLIH